MHLVLVNWEERKDFGTQCSLNWVTLINWGKPLAHQLEVIWSNPSLIAKVESRQKLLFWNIWFGNSEIRWRKIEGWSLKGSTDWWFGRPAFLQLTIQFSRYMLATHSLLSFGLSKEDNSFGNLYSEILRATHLRKRLQWTIQVGYDFAIDRLFHNSLSQRRLDTSISKHIHDWTHAILVARALNVIICQVGFLTAAVSSVVGQGKRATKAVEWRIIWWKFNSCIIEDGVHACKFAKERKQERIGRMESSADWAENRVGKRQHPEWDW